MVGVAVTDGVRVRVGVSCAVGGGVAVEVAEAVQAEFTFVSSVSTGSVTIRPVRVAASAVPVSCRSPGSGLLIDANTQGTNANNAHAEKMKRYRNGKAALVIAPF